MEFRFWAFWFVLDTWIGKVQLGVDMEVDKFFFIK